MKNIDDCMNGQGGTDRRFFLKTFIGALAAGWCAHLLNPLDTSWAADAGKNSSKTQKPLTIYFSQTGNTKKVAELIHSKVGGDILQIIPAKPYPDDYNTLVDMAKEELNKNVRPAIKNDIPDLSKYNVVFVGFPCWWGTMPMPVFTFLEQSGMDGKTIIPFDTHMGSGLGHSENDLKKICPDSKILKGLAIRGDRVSEAEKDIVSWLKGLGPALIETTTGNTKIYPQGAY